MALSDESWNEILTALTHKAADAGLPSHDLAGRLAQLKDHWEFFQDPTQVKAYIEAKELEALRVQKLRMAEQMVTVDARIKELE